MKVAFLADIPFPTGSAGASRVKNIAMALYELNALDRVISYRVVSRTNHSEVIPYESVLGYGDTSHSHNIVERYRNLLVSTLSAKKHLKKLIQYTKFDTLIFYTWNSIQVDPIIKMAKENNIKLIADVVEMPSKLSFRWGMANPLYWMNKRLINVSYNHVDGIIAISSYIENYYKQKNMNVFRIPALADPSIFQPCEIQKYSRERVFNIVYLGAMARKDDPFTLINAIKIISKEHNNIQLSIIGTDGEKGLAKDVKEYCHNDCTLNSKVIFYGKVPMDELLFHLSEADVFILPRDNKSDWRASFPTRLPELLLTSKPVITSDVGDLSEYLTNGYNSLLAKPGDYYNLSELVIELMESDEKRKKIGCNGRETAINYFYYRSYKEGLKSFLQAD